MIDRVQWWNDSSMYTCMTHARTDNATMLVYAGVTSFIIHGIHDGVDTYVPYTVTIARWEKSKNQVFVWGTIEVFYEPGSTRTADPEECYIVLNATDDAVSDVYVRKHN